MIHVGLKYCGGCTPDYDRVDFVDRLKEKTQGHVRLVHYEDPRAVHTLVVTGCETACVDMEPFKDKTVHLVFREEDLEPMAKELLSLNDK